MPILYNNQSFHMDTQVKAIIKHLKKAVANNTRKILHPMRITERKLLVKVHKARVNRV
jgi:hypothetical protein